MKILKQKWVTILHDKDFIISFIVAFLFLAVSLIVNFYAGNYATEKASSPVTDIILSNVPEFDVNTIFIWGPVVMFVFVTLISLYNPKRIPFVLKSIALFTVVRAVFISLTHLGPFPTQAVILNASNFVNKFTFGGDLFFSGHTGLPFLLALIFWREKSLRYIFLFLSAMFGVVVLLGHLHYSIDVLSAFFITYAIYHMSMFFFKKDYTVFHSNVHQNV